MEQLGQPLFGGMLQTLSPSASSQELVAALNTIINKLNQWDGVIVQRGHVQVPVNASPQALTTIPHGLNYQPSIDASVNNLGIPFTGSDTLSIPLPTFIHNASISGGLIGFDSYMFCMADENNVYFYSLNASGTDLGVFDVTFYLKRLAAQTL